jgi:hypothetical protein
MRLKFTIVVISILIVLTLMSSVIAYTEQIKPAPQQDGRGVGEQIRPANQMDLSTGYSPSEGSSYSSSGSNTNDRNDEIRPAPQQDGRGVGEQIRPANQMNLDTGYSPSEGSSYSSGEGTNEVEMDANLVATSETSGNISSTASGTGLFTVNKRANTLNYDILYQGLSSSETSATIDRISNGTESVLFTLPLGEHIVGVWTYDQSLEIDIINGMTYVKVDSQLFPNGELKGQIITI